MSSAPAQTDIDKAQQKAKEYLLQNGEIYLICPRCGMAMHETKVDDHYLHEHSSRPMPMPDPTSDKYAEDLLHLMRHMMRMEQEDEDDA